MNLENNIGENNYKHIYVFGCSHSLNTNSIDTKCKSYSEILGETLNIPIEHIYNYSINGSSNTENLYYLNCINSEFGFFHPMNDTLNIELPKKIYDNSLIIFQLTYWHRNAFQHTINKKNEYYEIIPILPSKEYIDTDITNFNKTYYKKLSNEILLQRNSISSVCYILKGISDERNNVSNVVISWDNLKDDTIKKYIPSELVNLQQISIDNKWTCHSEIKNNDIHLSPIGHQSFADYLVRFI